MTTAKLVTVQEFRVWFGAGAASQPDTVIQQCLDTAEQVMVQKVGCGTVDAIVTNLDANPVGRTEECLRAANLMAKRNSPEGVAGVGDEGLVFTVPASPAGTVDNITTIKRALGIPLVVVA